MSTWEPIKGETPIDPSYLRDKTITNREQLNIAEAKNILKPVVKYLAGKPSDKQAPFDLNWFKQLHDEMFCDVWEYAGQFRQEDLNIGIAWHQIQTELYQLEQDIRFWEANSTFPTLELSVHIDFRAVRIHPFLNGNGRWSRLLGNIYLKKKDHPIVRWPEETIGNQSPVRDEYLEAVKKADDGDMPPLLELYKQFLEMPADS